MVMGMYKVLQLHWLIIFRLTDPCAFVQLFDSDGFPILGGFKPSDLFGELSDQVTPWDPNRQLKFLL